MATMRERWVAFMARAGFTGPVLAQDAVKAAMRFAETDASPYREALESIAANGCDRRLADGRDGCKVYWSQIPQKWCAACTAGAALFAQLKEDGR